MGATSDLPDVDVLWDFTQPEASERAFRELLPLAGGAQDEIYRLEVLTQIARAQGLQRRFADAHRTLDEVEASLSSTVPRGRMRYLLERGRVRNSSGSPREASPLFHEAWDLGCAHGEDALAIDAAHMLGIVEPPEQQLAWNVRALDLAERSADPRARRWRGSLLNNIGWTYHGLARYDDALAMFRRAVSLQEAEGAPRQVITARWCVARALRALGHFSEALALQRDLQKELEQLGESDAYVHEELAECLLALGHADAARPHFATAHDVLSADPWLVANEPDRLRRLRKLGQMHAEFEATS